MQLPQCEIERAASKGDPRQYLTCILLDVEGKRLVASNGHALAVVPVEPGEGDTSGLIPADAFKQGRKGAAQIIEANGGIRFPDGSTMPRPDTETVGTFPDWQALVARFEPSGITLTVNAELLHDLARAITPKGSKYGRIVTIHLPKPTDDPRIVRAAKVEGADGAFGLIMPCRK